MLRMAALALALATAVCGVKGAPKPPLEEPADAGTSPADAGGLAGAIPDASAPLDGGPP
jgi:hypothetical protein